MNSNILQECRLHKWIPFLCALAILCGLMTFYAWFYEHVSMSLVSTLNGVWKAYDVQRYLAGGEGKGGHIWYYVTLVKMSRFLGLDSLEQYLWLIVQFNGASAAVANAALFLFVYYLRRKLWIAAIAVFFHIVVPGNFILSVNNEDIYPAYLCYMTGFFSLYSYLSTSKVVQLMLSSSLFAASMMFHWTMGVPAFSALGVTLVLYICQEGKQQLPKLYSHLAASLVAAGAVLIITGITTGTPLITVLYPSGEVGESLWISHFTLESVTLATSNNFFLLFLGSRPSWGGGLSTIVAMTAIVFLLTLIAPALPNIFRGYRKIGANRYAALFLIMVLITGTAMHAFEQGKDLQFIIQPMFMITFALALHLDNRSVESRLRLKIVSLMLAVSTLTTFSISSNNYNLDQIFWSEVSDFVNGVEAEMSRTVIVGDAFASLSALVGFVADRPEMIDVPSHWQWDKTTTAQQHARSLSDTIDYHMEDKDVLIALNLIRTNEEFLGKRYLGHDFTDMVRLVRTYIKEHYYVLDTLTWRNTEVTIMKACSGSLGCND